MQERMLEDCLNDTALYKQEVLLTEITFKQVTRTVLLKQ